MIDVLADVLRSSGVNTSLYFHAEINGSYAVDVPEQKRVIRFHLASQETWISLPTGDSIRFFEGDLVLVPHGCAHIISDRPNFEGTPLPDVMNEAETVGIGRVQIGSGQPVHNLFCGHFQFDEAILHPIVSQLPPLIRLQPDNQDGFSWLRGLLFTLHEEQLANVDGSAEIITRLSETVLIYLIRMYLASSPDNMPSVLANLTNSRLGKALRAIHHDPGFDWTLERLSEEANMSRSAFADRFRHEMGVPPMQYLSDWRMQKASALLQDRLLTITDVSAAVGYASDGAFATAFKKQFGVSPSVYRKQLK